MDFYRGVFYRKNSPGLANVRIPHLARHVSSGGVHRTRHPHEGGSRIMSTTAQVSYQVELHERREAFILLHRVAAIAAEYNFFVGDDRGNRLTEPQYHSAPTVLSLVRDENFGGTIRPNIIARFTLNASRYHLTFETYDKNPPYSLTLFLRECSDRGEFRVRAYQERPRWRSWLFRALSI